MTERLFLQITPAEYHDLPDVSSGGIRCFATQGPLMYHAQYVTREVKRADSESQRLGRAFHAAMDDPDSWKDGYAIIPTTLEDDEHYETVRKNWEGKKTKADLTIGTPLKFTFPAHGEYRDLHKAAALASGLEIIDASQLESVARMIESVYDNLAALDYVGTPARTEVACRAICPNTGLGLKALADRLMPDGTIVDFKTTKATTSNAFIREALYSYNYQYQAEWYLRVFGATRFVFISVRNSPPWESMVYSVPERILKQVKQANDFHLEALKGCYESDSWHSLGHGAELSLDDMERNPQ